MKKWSGFLSGKPRSSDHFIFWVAGWGLIVYNKYNNVVNLVEEASAMYLINELLSQAIQETENLLEGEIFLVKDLFKGYVWNRIPVRDRLLLGILFLNHVHQDESRVCAIEKTSSHQQRYQKRTTTSP